MPRFCSALKAIASLSFPLLGGLGVSGLGIEELCKTRIFRHVLEIGVVARLKTVLWIQADGLIQVLERSFYLSRQAIDDGHAVVSEVGLAILLENLLQVPARLIVLAGVNQRHRVIKVFFLRFETGGSGRELLVAEAQVDARAIQQLTRSNGNDLLQERFGLFEFVLLHGFDRALVVLHSLCKAWVFSERRLWRRGRRLLP